MCELFLQPAARSPAAAADSAPAAGSGAGQSVLLTDEQRATQAHPVANAPLPPLGSQHCSSLREWVRNEKHHASQPQ